MGKIPMTCPRCGNSDVNKMVVFFKGKTIDNAIAGDATTVSKFLFELMYPEHPKMKHALKLLLIEEQLVAIRIRYIRCEKCLEEGHGEVKIKPTQFSI